jgi:hypothetical protein
VVKYRRSTSAATFGIILIFRSARVVEIRVGKVLHRRMLGVFGNQTVKSAMFPGLLRSACSSADAAGAGKTRCAPEIHCALNDNFHYVAR